MLSPVRRRWLPDKSFRPQEQQPDDYIVWQNTKDQIIVMMGVDGSVYFGYSYYPLRLRLVDGKWLCDETYRNYFGHIGWRIAE